jgi:hypothetical protein
MNKRTLFLTTLAIALVSFLTVRGQQPPPRPKLVLVLSIDQMRFDYLTRFAPLYKGGMRTLGERGAVYSHANYRHSAAETGPGHSVFTFWTTSEPFRHSRQRMVGSLSEETGQRGG